MSEKCREKGKDSSNKAKKEEEERKAAEKAEKPKSKRAKRKERRKERKALEAEEAKKTADAGIIDRQTSSSETSEVDSPVKLGPLAARRMRVGLE